MMTILCLDAYMLMYRRVEYDKNASFIRTADLPEHLVELKEKWIRDELEEEKNRKHQESLVKVSIVSGSLVTD